MVDVADGRVRPHATKRIILPCTPKNKAHGKQRYYKEANRLYGVLDRRLAAHEFVAGQDLSIADIAIFPWTQQSGVRVSIL